TDPEPLPSEAAGLDGRPEARNLVGIYATLADIGVDDVLRDFAGKGFGAFKPALGDLLIEKLGPINARFVALKDDRTALDAILNKGAEKARTLAKPTLDATYDVMGLCR